VVGIESAGDVQPGIFAAFKRCLPAFEQGGFVLARFQAFATSVLTATVIFLVLGVFDPLPEREVRNLRCKSPLARGNGI